MKISKILLFIIIIFSNCNKESEIKNRKEKKQNYQKETIYIYARFWGITGDHQEIIFSEKPIKLPPDKERNYIFYRDEIFYKLKNDDTLIIYAPKSGKSIPKIPFKNIKVILKDLKTFDDIKEISMNYQKYNLEKISVRE